MKKSEPILKAIARLTIQIIFQCEAANGYWAILLHESHQYKTAFRTCIGHYCYRRMGQGLTGGPATYTRLKDLAMGPIPGPEGEPALAGVAADTMLKSFMDDNFGEADTVMDLYNLLHHHYFPLLAWARLTLSSPTSKFVVTSLDILGHIKP